jgi:hypothetical protein
MKKNLAQAEKELNLAIQKMIEKYKLGKCKQNEDEYIMSILLAMNKLRKMQMKIKKRNESRMKMQFYSISHDHIKFLFDNWDED